MYFFYFRNEKKLKQNFKKKVKKMQSENLVAFVFLIVSLALSSSIESVPLNEQNLKSDLDNLMESNSKHISMPLSDESKEEELNVLKFVCTNLINSDEWPKLKNTIKEACILVLINQNNNFLNNNLNLNNMNRQRRFFALQVGKNNPLMHNEKSNKGFKYGRK